MENRDRDQMGKNNQSTSVGDVNRNTSSQIEKDKSDSSADFGQNKGRSDNLSEPNSRGSQSGGYSSSSKSDRDLDSSSSSSSSSSSGMGQPSGNSSSTGGSRH